MRPARAPLPLRQAIALGLIQGPTELLPLSSSAHTSLIPWLCGWSYAALDAERRKGFEIALHAGAGLALAVEMRSELADGLLRASRSAHAGRLALSLAPPALAGLLLRRQIERRCGGPRSIAVALLAGAGAMALADATAPSGRRTEQAGALDGLALGLAQALALIPGISRSGATLATARARGYAPAEAARLSWEAGLPVIVGVGMLEALRSVRRGASGETRAALVAGGGASFLSTLLAARLTRGTRSRGTALLPFAAYRSLLAILVVRRLRSAHNRDG